MGPLERSSTVLSRFGMFWRVWSVRDYFVRSCFTFLAWSTFWSGILLANNIWLYSNLTLLTFDSTYNWLNWHLTLLTIDCAHNWLYSQLVVFTIGNIIEHCSIYFWQCLECLWHLWKGLAILVSTTMNCTVTYFSIQYSKLLRNRNNFFFTT